MASVIALSVFPNGLGGHGCREGAAPSAVHSQPARGAEGAQRIEIHIHADAVAEGEPALLKLILDALAPVFPSERYSIGIDLGGAEGCESFTREPCQRGAA